MAVSLSAYCGGLQRAERLGPLGNPCLGGTGAVGAKRSLDLRLGFPGFSLARPSSNFPMMDWSEGSSVSS